jgi:hypothetical protein
LKITHSAATQTASPTISTAQIHGLAATNAIKACMVVPLDGNLREGAGAVNHVAGLGWGVEGDLRGGAPKFDVFVFCS